MDIEGGVILTAEQMQQWVAMYPEEYEEYIEAGLLDPETGELLGIPEWMEDGDPANGPFDFILNPSQKHTGF